MELDKIIAISGRPGLYEVEVQTRMGFIAHSLTDGKRNKPHTGLNFNFIKAWAT